MRLRGASARKTSALTTGKVWVDKKIHPIRFLAIISLLDKPYIVRELSRLRKKWGVDQSLVKNTEATVQAWKKFRLQMSEAESVKHQTLQELFSQKYQKKDWIYFPISFFKMAQYSKDSLKLYCSTKEGDFANNIETLLDNSRRTDSFRRIVERALICGSVTRNNVLPPSVKIKKQEPFWQYPVYSSLELVIATDPYTTEDELLMAFRKRGEAIRERYLRVIFSRIYNPKHIPEAKRNRDWYWRNKCGESVTDIAYSELIENQKISLGDNWTKNQLPNYRGIAKAISQYKKLLRMNF